MAAAVVTHTQETIGQVTTAFSIPHIYLFQLFAHLTNYLHFFVERPIFGIGICDCTIFISFLGWVEPELAETVKAGGRYDTWL